MKTPYDFIQDRIKQAFIDLDKAIQSGAVYVPQGERDTASLELLSTEFMLLEAWKRITGRETEPA